MSEASQSCNAEKSNSAVGSSEVGCGAAASSSPGSQVGGAGGTTKPFPYVVKTPRADSKLILQNMEEVLNSVKRKHRQKHRRKREQKKKALQEAEAAAAENASSADAAKMSQKNPKHPLQESKKNVDEVAGEIRSPLKASTILDHFARTPKKQSDGTETNPDVNGSAATVKKANAFEVMMNARNKSIGSNTPGKEAVPEEIDEEQKSTSVKRKVFLQDWAERKGGNKRRLEEDAKDAYIEKTMKHRAKRFKEMLSNGRVEKSEEKPTTSIDKSDEKPSTKVSHSKDQTGRKSKRNSRHSRRLSSVDSVESVDTTSQESSGFLAKLSSPIKKRDSLLGYFPKKPSSVDETKVKKVLQIESVLDDTTPKRPKRGRPPKVHQVSTPTQLDAEEVETKEVEVKEVEPVTSSGRPRRQCSGKSKYDQDQSPIPMKVEEKNSTRASKKSTKDEVPELDIIDVDSDSPKQTPKKLAPLFIKALPKPSPNPELLRAKQQFLMSGVPEKMRLEMAKQKQYEQSYEEAIEEFPRVSHIRQLSPDEEAANTGEFVVTFKLRKEEEQKTPTRKIRKRAIGSFTMCNPKDFRGQHKNKTDAPVMPIPLPQIENKRLVIKDWKITYDRFPTFRCYNQLREKYRYFSAIDSGQEAEQVTESFVVTRSSSRRSLSKAKFDPDAEEEKPPPSAPNGELLFTEKYKAMSSDQVLVNMAPVNQLKEFLSSWRGATRANESAIDFDLNDSSNSNISSSCNSVVLLGPTSSGKTNAVFALANEMNFNVLEINAGMKRTGKKLLQELQEATQSHQIRKDTTAKGKNLLKMTLNGLKQKKKQSAEDSSSEHDLEQSARKSLILVEDADVIFEQHDAGFVDALYTLASTSKRPVIIVATKPNCQHLQRLINQNAIQFTPPNVLNISKFLSVLSLIENCPVELNDLVSLYLLNRKHLRKTILELQFYIQSGGDRPKVKKTTTSEDAQFFASPTKRRFSIESTTISESAIDDEAEKGKKKSDSTEIILHKGLFEFYTVCQNIKCRIPFPVDFHLLHTNLSEIFKVSRNLLPTSASTRRKSKSPKKAWLSAANRPSVTRSLSDFYENLSVSTMIAGVQECEDRLSSNLSEDLAHCLVERAIEKNLSAGHYAYNLFDTPHCSITLANFSPVLPLRSSRSMALDYEPSLRSICRSEKTRSCLERRGSRFYHYLRNSCVNLGSFSTDQFDNACDILTDPAIEVLSQESQKSN